MARYKEQWASPTDQTLKGYFDEQTNNQISIAPGNKQYSEVLAWIADGNTADPAYTQAEIDDYQAEIDRQNNIDTAQETSGLKHATVQQAYNYIDNTLDAASTAAEVKEAVRDIFKKIAVFLLK